MQFCFCELHHLWQKPTVKNTDGLICEFLLKGADFSRVADGEVRHTVGLICDRARKVLEYKTANEVYKGMVRSV
ncbi:hypothetical protein [Atopobium sp. oral taxon 416]|uniref:hypothetical protein n=1 Tax=Atopobium sp. oral taxon 416 TaxID=712157 RepID=UPI001BA4E2D5|nr:hypothetical protein [Atopobium sp. oral taxon 416]QUC02282.1 hypothetical protein J4859_09495 [Atopobium sp. oral taxon 416]